MGETTTQETFLALRRTDGEPLGDYGWISASESDPWSDANDWATEDEEPFELELVRMSVESVEKRTVGGPRPVCDEWTGFEQEAGTRWEVVIRKGKDDETWPGRPVSLATFDDPTEADAAIAAMPEVFHHHTYGMRTQEIERSSLLVVPKDQYGYVSNCATCGHPRSDHV